MTTPKPPAEDSRAVTRALLERVVAMRDSRDTRDTRDVLVPPREAPPPPVPRRARGQQKAPTKQLISLRLDKSTIAVYRATGPGWQSRINADLAKAARRLAPSGPKASLARKPSSVRISKSHQ